MYLESPEINDDRQFADYKEQIETSLHVHNDIEEAAKFYKIPLCFYDWDDVYILQEDRCVFVGSINNAKRWIKINEGKLCPSKFPINGI